MATISESLANELVKNNGVYPGDPQCYAVFKYLNPHFGNWCFAVAYDEADFARYSSYEMQVLWRKDGEDRLH